MWPAIATRGAHGLEAMATTAPGLAWGTKGSVVTPSGIAGVPDGLPSEAGSSLNSNFGLALAEATLPVFSRAPPSIHLRMISISESGILAEAGGILGSSWCVTTRRSLLLSGSPGSTTLPEPPPCIVPPKLSRFRPPFCLSGLWQEPQRLRKTCDTWSWKVTFALGGSAARPTETNPRTA